MDADSSTVTRPAGTQGAPLPPAAPRPAADVEREQEALLMRKYGGLKPKKKSSSGGAKEHKFFDSADWVLAKQGIKPNDAPLVTGQPVSGLEPKLEPTTVPPRRVSHLGGDTEAL